MKLESLGYRTDLIFTRFNGEVIDRGDYIVGRTANNPQFHWGNFLIFPRPPEEGDAPIWLAAFDREIASQQPTTHIALGWQGDEPGHVQPFLDKGLRLDSAVVLATGSVQPPPRPNDAVKVRRVRTDEDWGQVLESQIAGRDTERFGEVSYRAYLEPKLRNYRAMEVAGRGHWFGAFLGDILVADLGVFFEGDVARYQTVQTHPNYRRQGICGTLVYQSACFALAHFGIDTLVMVADPDYHAARIYESVGFAPREKQLAIDWCEKEP